MLVASNLGGHNNLPLVTFHPMIAPKKYNIYTRTFIKGHHYGNIFSLNTKMGPLSFTPSTFFGHPPRTQLFTSRSPCARQRHGVFAQLKVAVAGGGLGGLALASYLVKHGVDVTVYEQARKYRPFGGPIQVQSNALALLADVDTAITDAIYDQGTPTGNRLSGIKDGLSDEWYSTFDTGIPATRRGLPLTHVVDRPRLQRIFLNFIDSHAPKTVRTGAPVHSYSVQDNFVSVKLADGSIEHADILIGADGIWSSVRAQMHGEADPRASARYSGYTCYTATCRHSCIDRESVAYKIYLGRKQYFVCSDVGDGRLQWYAFLGEPAGGAQEPNKLERLASKFADWSSEVRAILAATVEAEVGKRDLYDRAPLMHKGWTDRRVALLGDAAHPMMPNLGQGGCMAFEDAHRLGVTIRKLNKSANVDATNIRDALKQYERQRLPRTAIVQGLARMSSDLLFHYDRLATGGTEALLGWGVFWSTVGSWVVGGSMPMVLDYLYVNLLDEKSSQRPVAVVDGVSSQQGKQMRELSTVYVNQK